MTKSKNKCKAIIYCRISPSIQAKGGWNINHSIATQELLCKKAISIGNYKLAEKGLYFDTKKSGLDMNRSGLKKLLTRVRNDKEVRAVFVHNHDRIARSANDYLKIEKTLQKAGVIIIAAQEETRAPVPLPLSPEQNFLELVMAAVANLGREILSKKIKHGLLLKKQRCGKGTNVIAIKHKLRHSKNNQN